MSPTTTTDPRGYVLRYVGKKHHLADVRGYAYEHRIVAERAIGRRLETGEEVHHRDENPSNNDASNLEVARNHAEHMAKHRTNPKKRPVGAANPVIKCRCGCGVEFEKFDAFGRPRTYARGCSGRRGSGKRNSTEEVACACGCGTKFNKYDRGGRVRRFVSGHNGGAR